MQIPSAISISCGSAKSVSKSASKKFFTSSSDSSFSIEGLSPDEVQQKWWERLWVKHPNLASALVKGEEEIEKVKKQVESYEQIKEMISVDTLKTMQLLGFNYKAAIGEPLTQICADAISNMSSKNKTNTPTQKKR